MNVHTLIFFGDQLKTWLTNDFNNDVFSNWSNIEIILGNRRTQKDSSSITLLAKQYINKCKMKHFIPSIEPFKLHLRAYILSESFHALMSATFDKFFQTLWFSGGATIRNTDLFQLSMGYYV
mgnify:CR=1 FL=1